MPFRAAFESAESNVGIIAAASAHRRRDHEKDHGPIDRFVRGPPSRHRGNDAEQDGARHDDLRVATFEPLDEQLSLRPIGLRFLHELDDASQEGLSWCSCDGHIQPAVSVDRSRKDLRTCGLVDWRGLPRDGSLVYRGAAFGDRAIRRDSRAGPYDDSVAQAQFRRRQHLLDAVVQTHSFIRREGHEGRDVARRSRARVALEGAAQGENEDEEGAVEPLSDGCGADRGDDHQQVDVERSISHEREEAIAGLAVSAEHVAED